MLDAVLTPAMMLAANGDGWDGHGGWWFFFPLIPLFWIAVFFFFFWFFGRRWRWRGHEMSATDRARNILAERYARGEISSEEYRDRYDQLK